ncbi:hypothetical protein [Nocardia transvalensis]|uniref:hypothetical protein n=1 Tax=Nocardia transvalensis TaxID=37333 RepID=UPI0018959A52|nr:hypothetical protein [Nocardia transvalensis]MBF6328278.1 hypothetical protein [Nocardia transvalensis]
MAGRLDAVPALSTVMEGQGLHARWAARPPRLEHHVHERQVSADETVQAVMRELSRAPFPSGGPRWDLTILHGYVSGRYAIVYRAQHGLQDGGALAYTLETLFSGRAIEHAQSSGVARVLLDPPSPTLRQTAAVASLLARSNAKTDLWPHPEYGYSQEQSLHWADVPTAVLREAARRHGGTTNDAYVACVARTFNHWLAAHAAHASGAVLPLNVAVNFRPPADAAVPGNRSVALRVMLPGHAAPRAGSLGAAIRATAPLKSAAHREAVRRLIQRIPRGLVHRSMRPFLAPERGAIFCSHVTFRNPLHWREDPVETIEPLVLLPLGAPAAAVLYNYQERSSVLFVSDAALPEMDILHHTWQEQAHQLGDS